MSSNLANNLPANPTSTTRKYPIDGQVFKPLIEAALNWLRTNQQTVNALNVFPVPDGDTGTNMVLTMQAAYDEIADLPERNVGKLAHAIAHGALMGARGNSGVILSQLWRGFARALDNQETMDGLSLVSAFHQARNTAYKGVVRPVEGTILTVAKDVAAAAEHALTETSDPYDILERIIPEADRSVQHTPELLSVLRDAGVVDAGGKGLFYLLEGMVRYINGLPLDTPLATIQPLASMKFQNTLDNIEPGQDYEVVVDFRPTEPLNLIDFFEHLEQLGTSIQIGEGDGIYRMHIHVPSENLYEPIEYTKSLGTVTKAAIENLVAQMEDLERESERKLKLTPVEPGQIATIVVAPGPGIARVFASLGVSAIVEGGQTMNPSTQEILHAFENLPTDQIFILPNNKNIILAAQAAAQLTVKHVTVIPSRTVPQGMAAMMRLIPDGNPENVAAEMVEALTDVETGEITTATRSVEIDGVAVQEGQYIALLNGKLVLASATLKEATLGFLEHAHADHFELITLFYGAEINRREVDAIADTIRKIYPEQELEVQEGGQPHYHFIFAIE
ncbi:MAG TPA: DAK2 domain-containing protein [Anaerolineales bacterium]|nr:DAK2 domain-containing protein [Anaerolineales bacterium]